MADDSSKSTTDHTIIQEWVENRGGSPSVVKATQTQDPQNIGELRIDFPGYSGADSLEHISWDDFFQTFDHKKLSFLYQDETSDGAKSNFCKFVSRE